MLASLVDLDFPARPSLLRGAAEAGQQLRAAARLTLCPGVEVVLDLWKSDPDVFRPKRFPSDPDWHERARCRGIGDELFFRGSTVGPQTRRRSLHEARAYCRPCPAIRECLRHAFSVPEHFGVWGGTSARQRAPLVAMIESGALSVEEAIEACLS